VFKKPVDLNSCTFRSADSVPYVLRRCQLKPINAKLSETLQIFQASVLLRSNVPSLGNCFPFWGDMVSSSRAEISKELDIGPLQTRPPLRLKTSGINYPARGVTSQKNGDLYYTPAKANKLSHNRSVSIIGHSITRSPDRTPKTVAGREVDHVKSSVL